MSAPALPAIGCVGCGNMGGAILGGLARCATGPLGRLVGHDPDTARIDALNTPEGAHITAAPDALTLARDCDVVILAVKPYLAEGVVRGMAPALPGKLLLSIAAGVTLAQLRDWTNGACAVVRCMPNTPALVGKGVFALCLDDPQLTEGHKALCRSIFNALGTPMELPERLMTAFTSLVGAGPAYVFYLLDALVQAGMTLGFTAAQAREMVLKLFDGSVAMAGASPHSLATLREQVCSPAGVTIAGINQLDRDGVRGKLIDAVLATEARGREMEQS